MAGTSLLAALLAAAASRFFGRVEVQGDSMRPTLLPGDRLVVLRTRRVTAGDMAVVRDPRSGRLMVKRVASVAGRAVMVVGDNVSASTDSRAFGPLAGVEGRPVYRYHPRRRASPIRRHEGRNTGPGPAVP